MTIQLKGLETELTARQLTARIIYVFSLCKHGVCSLDPEFMTPSYLS
jgi:hypothetical protein